MDVLTTNREMKRNSPCSPVDQNTAPSSCIYFSCSRLRHIRQMSGLNILTCFVVTDAFWTSACEVKPNQRKNYKFTNSWPKSGQSKQTTGVKTPWVTFNDQLNECLYTDCVRRVKAALVIEVGRLSPLVISLHSFLLITSTRPPFSVTSLYSMYRSRTCLAMMGIRFTGVPAATGNRKKIQSCSTNKIHMK